MIINYDDYFYLSPFELEAEQKEQMFLSTMASLCEYHKNHCLSYQKVVELFDYSRDGLTSLEQVPFVPVRLFKEFELSSLGGEAPYKTMTSSGTSGQVPSKIFLDKLTAQNQQRTLVKIVADFIGEKRMPMLIIDSPSVLKERKMFSARGAGILGFSIFGARREYALDADMQLNIEAIQQFLQTHKGKPVLLFGFTFVVWKYFLQALLESGVECDLSNAILIHGGGWKKLVNEAVSPEVFKQRLNEVCGLERVHDYYGMVEQTGCIHMECEHGHLHTSIFSDVLIRNPADFSLCETGEKGIIQVLSVLPYSYPGHSLLTEDEGILLGEDDCPCGRKGRYFKVSGRLKSAEIRGCSDTFESV